MTHSAALVDEIANELRTWPGVRIERRADGTALVGYHQLELGVLYRDPGHGSADVTAVLKRG